VQLTKLGHACVRLEKAGATLVIDPGVWSGPDVLAGAQAILVTHEHPDHFDADAIRAAMAVDPDVTLFANSSVTDQFPGLGVRVRPVSHGDAVEAAGFSVHVYGHEHAQIMPGVPVPHNTGFLVDGTVFHPGDSFTIPEDPAPTLLLPVSAPWLKFAEVADYARAVAPERGGYAIHDAILSPEGTGLVSRLLGQVTGPGIGPLSRLEPGTTVEV
jgi:L-ascorbate metabolism protein UlaG (beta-lactamase superfamily)